MPLPPLDDARAILADLRDAADPTASLLRALANARPHATALLAVGKASIAMARAAPSILDIPRAILTCVPEHAPHADLPAWFEILPADHPLPTPRNLLAASRVEAFLRSLGEDDELLALISGGGSAHLCAPADGLTLDDLTAVTRAMLRAGAPIDALNAVRKHCERLKGGLAARLASPARVRALVLSDVIGDRLDTISSGPFAPDATTYADAIDALRTHAALDASPAIRGHLERGRAGEVPETPKVGDPCFARVTHEIIASNRALVEAARRSCERLGHRVREARVAHTGSAGELGREMGARARALEPPGAIIVGGETTVDASGAPGVGGRNQEVALAAAIEIDGRDGVVVLAYASDGVDGPTDAAGAIVDGSTCEAMRSAGIDPARALREHDSHRALDAAGALIRTGPTGTNVNDIAIALTRGSERAWGR